MIDPVASSNNNVAKQDQVCFFTFCFFSFYYFLFSKILFLSPLSRGTLEQGRSEAIALSTPTA